MSLRTLLAFLVGVCAFVGASSSASAQSAQRYLKQQHDRAAHLLERPARGPEARERRTSQVNRLLSELFDYQEHARRALDSHWNEHNGAERAEFVELLRQLVERSYQGNLERVLDYNIRYTGEQDFDGGVVVQTEASSLENRRAPDLEINYRMHRTDGGRWRVFDIETDGVSMIATHRDQFDRIIRRDGWDALLRRMRERLQEDSDL